MKTGADSANNRINESLRSIQSSLNDIKRHYRAMEDTIELRIDSEIDRAHNMLSWTELLWRIVIIVTMIFGCYHIYNQGNALEECNRNLSLNNAILLTNKQFWYDEKNHELYCKSHKDLQEFVNQQKSK